MEFGSPETPELQKDNAMNPSIILSGISIALCVWTIIAWLSNSHETAGHVTSTEKRRRQHIQGGNLVYHWIGGLVRSIATKIDRLPVSTFRSVDTHLSRSGHPLPWTAQEWVAATLIESVLMAMGGTAAWMSWMDGSLEIVLLFPMIALAYIVVAYRKLRKRASLRMQSLRTRLPFVIDAIGLSMEAGTGIQESLLMAARSCPDSAVGQELSLVVADTQRGQALGVVFDAMKTRLQDPMVDEFIMAANTSHQMGAGVSGVLLGMAKRMRERRSHEIEAAAGRAQIQLYYPGMLLMLVCLVAVVAPFIAPMWNFLSGNHP